MITIAGSYAPGFFPYTSETCYPQSNLMRLAAAQAFKTLTVQYIRYIEMMPHCVKHTAQMYSNCVLFAAVRDIRLDTIHTQLSCTDYLRECVIPVGNQKKVKHESEQTPENYNTKSVQCVNTAGFVSRNKCLKSALNYMTTS
jgi:hypothetical protein